VKRGKGVVEVDESALRVGDEQRVADAGERRFELSLARTQLLLRAALVAQDRGVEPLAIDEDL